MVTLPAKWVKEYNIKAGSEVDLNSEGSTLSVSTELKDAETKPNTLFFDATKYHEFNKNYLNYFYREGYDEITIKYSDTSVINKIQNRLTELLGLIIIDRTEDTCKIKCVSQENVQEFDSTLRRLFRVTLDFGDSIHDALDKKEFERLTHIRQLEPTTNMLAEFLMRTIQKKGYKEQDKSYFIYSIVRELEQIGDRYKYLIDFIIHNKEKKVSSQFVKTLKDVNTYLRTFYETFYDFSFDRANKINNQRYKLVKEIHDYAKKNPKEAMIFQYLLMITQRIYELNGPLHNLVM